MRIRDLVFIGTIIFFGCGSKKKELHLPNNEFADKVDTLQKRRFKKKEVRDSLAIGRIENLLISGKIQILELENVVLMDSTSIINNECIEWSITKMDLVKIVKMSKRIESEEMHYLYSDLPCRINGRISLNGLEFNVIVNAGSFLYFSNKEIYFFLGCPGKSCNTFFLEPPLAVE